jgi:hypothetical protein
LRALALRRRVQVQQRHPPGTAGPGAFAGKAAARLACCANWRGATALMLPTLDVKSRPQ